MKVDQLRGGSVVVTGASSGIGRATAVAFAERGADLTLAARREEALREVERQVSGFGAGTLVVPTDISVRADVEALVEAALGKFGRVDIFVSNAGRYLRCPVRELSVEQIEEMMAVNFYGTVYSILEVLPHMLSRGSGHIVVVSSVDGKKGIPPDGAYVASKFAVTGFAEVLRQELRGTGVHLSTIFPGRIDTPMMADVRAPAISAKLPPEKVAGAIVRAVLKRKAEVLIPRVRSKTLLLANAVSARIGDRLVSSLRLEGVEED